VDFVLEGVELGVPGGRIFPGEGIFFEGPADGFDVEPELSGDEFLGEFIGEEEVMDIGPGF
jgi:hypothetical protein